MSTPENSSTASEITVRYSNNIPFDARARISNSTDAFLALWPVFQPHQEAHEAFRVLLLDRANRLKGIYTMSLGGVAGTVADPKLIFAVALRTLSSSIILAHNHPSGECRPSQEDIALTTKLVQGARFLDIVVADHIILCGPDRFYSFADNFMLG